MRYFFNNRIIIIFQEEKKKVTNTQDSKIIIKIQRQVVVTFSIRTTLLVACHGIHGSFGVSLSFSLSFRITLEGVYSRRTPQYQPRPISLRAVPIQPLLVARVAVSLLKSADSFSQSSSSQPIQVTFEKSQSDVRENYKFTYKFRKEILFCSKVF